MKGWLRFEKINFVYLTKTSSQQFLFMLGIVFSKYSNEIKGVLEKSFYNTPTYKAFGNLLNYNLPNFIITDDQIIFRKELYNIG